MYNLTRQERRVILFLTGLVITGLGANFFTKINSRPEDFIEIEERGAKLGINSAGYEELVSLKGISPKLAKKIIEYRDENGPFLDLEELKKVKGIGDYRLEKLRDYFTVQ